MNKRVALRLLIVTLLGCLAIVPATPSQAGPVALTTPPGIKPGEMFQFVFLTNNATTAVSNDIATYNKFVNSAAGGATYNGKTVTWLAIASTPTVSAITNTGSNPYPVFETNGTKVATSTKTTEGGLYSGTWLVPIDINVNGKPPTAPPGITWTGTEQDGSIAKDKALGDPEPNYGSAKFRDDFQLFRATQANDSKSPMYAISVGLMAVPEPSTYLLMAIGMTIVMVQTGLRRRNAQRRRGFVGTSW
jgi:PEP-CTERM motif